MKVMGVILRAVLCIVIGCALVCFVGCRKEWIDVIHSFWPGYTGAKFDLETIDILKGIIGLLIVMVIGVCLTYSVRFFANHKLTKIALFFSNLISGCLIAVPVSIIVILLVDHFLNTMVKTIDPIICLLIDIICFAFLLYFIFKVVAQLVINDYVKPHRGYRLWVVEVVDEHSVKDVEMIGKKTTFQKCYDNILANQNTLGNQQYFCIREYNWSGKKVIDSKSYYKDRTMIEISDEELCKKMLVAKYAENVKWGN